MYFIPAPGPHQSCPQGTAVTLSPEPPPARPAGEEAGSGLREKRRRPAAHGLDPTPPRGGPKAGTHVLYSMQRNVSKAVLPAPTNFSLQNDPEETHTDGGGELHLRTESSCNILLACLQQDSPHRPFLPSNPTASQQILLKRAKATRSVPTGSHHQMVAQSNWRSPRSGPKHQAPDPWDRCPTLWPSGLPCSSSVPDDSSRPPGPP